MKQRSMNLAADQRNRQKQKPGRSWIAQRIQIFEKGASPAVLSTALRRTESARPCKHRNHGCHYGLHKAEGEMIVKGLSVHTVPSSTVYINKNMGSRGIGKYKDQDGSRAEARLEEECLRVLQLLPAILSASAIVASLDIDHHSKMAEKGHKVDGVSRERQLRRKRGRSEIDRGKLHSRRICTHSPLSASCSKSVYNQAIAKIDSPTGRH